MFNCLIQYMKKTMLVLVLFFISAAYGLSETSISLTISKNTSGELILTVKGHTTPVTITIGSNSVTLYVEENKVNLTALGINELTEISVEEVDTAAGSETATDTQAAAPILPVSPFINPNPPLTTPF